MKSLEEKLIEMNKIAIQLEKVSDLSEKDKNFVWFISEGFAEKFILDRINCRCSLSEILRYSFHDLEIYVKEKIQKLKNLKRRLENGKTKV